MVEAQEEQQHQRSQERARIQGLIAPLKADKAAWEASFTEEERAKGQEFESNLKTDHELLQAFMNEIDTTFNDCDANADGRLTRDEFKNFVITMNNHGVARGLKNRETTEEFIEMVYPAFSEFNTAQEGVTKNEILTILNLINNEW